LIWTQITNAWVGMDEVPCGECHVHDEKHHDGGHKKLLFPR